MKRRSILKMLLLTIVTLGFYDLYWIWSTRQELVAKGQRVPRFIILLVPILMLIVVFPLLFIGMALTPGGFTYGNDNAIINVLVVIFGIGGVLAILVVGLWWFYKYCKAAEVVTNQDMTFEVSYVLLILTNLINVGFAWPLFVQYHFNKLSDATPGVADQPYPTVPPVAA
jgi:hypothetical protein